jgi:mandelate racemase
MRDPRFGFRYSADMEQATGQADNHNDTIAHTRVRPVSLIPTRPVETAAGTLTTTPLVLIDVTTADGIVGRSYLRTYTPVALEPLAMLVVNLAELVRGAPTDPARVGDRLRTELRLLGRRGLAGAAMAGLDMALWDVVAKRVGAPLSTVLGGGPRPVRAYASLRRMAADGAAADAEEAVAAGFTAVKVKVRPGEERAPIRAIRSAVGDSVKLMLDYNQSLRVTEALRRLPALDAEGLHWIEEPVPADDLAGTAAVAAAVRTPIQTGENWEELRTGVSDLVTFDVMRLGGVTGWRRAAELAQQAGVEVSSHTFGEVSAHLLAVTPTAGWFEYLDHVGPILTEPLLPRDGWVTAPDRPGNGLEWDEEVLKSLQS